MPCTAQRRLDEIVLRSKLLETDVAMSGGMNGRQLAENAIIHHGRLEQGVDLLSKPYRRQDLAAKLRKVLDERAITREKSL